VPADAQDNDMSARRIRVGTAGWAVPRAVAGEFGAEGSALIRYATRLDAAEINSTFWRRHRPGTMARWREAVPRTFRFSVKLARTITHDQALRDVRPLLRQFFSDVAELGDRLGPVLIQLPPSLAFDKRSAVTFFRAVREHHDGGIALEPRHESWFTAPVDALLVREQVSRVAADPPRVPGGEVPGGDPALVYFRLHGSPVMYRSVYGAARLAELAGRLRDLPSSAVVWCIFDNTASGAGAADALVLADLLRERRAKRAPRAFGDVRRR
jgi:uncharacterized protein YecE (DUF72 family)